MGRRKETNTIVGRGTRWVPAMLVLTGAMQVAETAASSAAYRLYSASFRLTVEGSAVANNAFQTLAGSTVNHRNNRTVPANTRDFIAGLNAALAGFTAEHVRFESPGAISFAIVSAGMTRPPQACGALLGGNGTGTGVVSYVDTASGVCRPCTVCGTGQYQTRTCGLTDAECLTACRPGTYGRHEGNNWPGTCQACESGLFAANEGQTACDPCPPGTFASWSGATRCEPCGKGTTSLNGSSMCFDEVRACVRSPQPPLLVCTVARRIDGKRIYIGYARSSDYFTSGSNAHRNVAQYL
jgi:hypothetical protein